MNNYYAMHMQLIYKRLEQYSQQLYYCIDSYWYIGVNLTL